MFLTRLMEVIRKLRVLGVVVIVIKGTEIKINYLLPNSFSIFFYMTSLLIMYIDINIKLYKYKLKNVIAFVITPFVSSVKFLKKELYKIILMFYALAKIIKMKWKVLNRYYNNAFRPIFYSHSY